MVLPTASRILSVWPRPILRAPEAISSFMAFSLAQALDPALRARGEAGLHVVEQAAKAAEQGYGCIPHRPGTFQVGLRRQPAAQQGGVSVVLVDHEAVHRLLLAVDMPIVHPCALG